MCRSFRAGRVNVRLLVGVVVVVVVVGLAAVGARYLHKRQTAEKALALGRAAMEKGDFKSAARQFREYLSKYPDNLEVLELYAQASLSREPLKLEFIQAAVAAYRRMVRLDPQNPMPYEKLAAIYAGLRRYEDLEYIARQRLKHAPNDYAAKLWLCSALRNQKKNAQAEQILRDLLAELEKRPKGEKHDEYVEACGLLASMAMEQGGPDAQATALDWLNRAVRYDPQNAAGYVRRARFYRLQSLSDRRDAKQRLALARADLEKADTLAIEDPRLYLILCGEWVEHGELERAAAEIEKARKLPREAVSRYFVNFDDWRATLFVSQADVALRLGKLDDALAEAAKLLDRLVDPVRRAMVLPSAIELLLRAGRVDEARTYLDEYQSLPTTAAQQGTMREVTALLTALVARAQNRPYEVITALQPYLEQAPRRSEILKLLAEAYIRVGQSRQAIAALTRYLRRRPRDRAAIVQLARQYLKERRFAEALETARLLEAMGAADIESRLVRIEAGVQAVASRSRLAAEVDLDRLQRELAELRKAHPKYVEIRQLQASIAAVRGDTKRAEQELRQAIAECDDTLPAELMLASFLARTQRLDEARDVARQACEEHPDSADAWIGLAQILELRSEPEQARAALEEGLRRIRETPERRNVALRLAVFDLRHERRKEGIERLKALAAENPRDVRPRRLLLELHEVRSDAALAGQLIDELRRIEGQGGLYWRLYQAAIWLFAPDWRARQQDIEDLLKVCVDADPGWSAPVLLLGEMYRRLERADAAEALYRQALAANPTAFDVADQLVNLLEKRERYAEARDVLERLEADAGFVRQRRIALALGEGDLSDAIRELELKIADDPKDADSRILLARLVYQQTRDATRALKYLDQAEKIRPGSLEAAAVRALILRAEGRLDEAKAVLDQRVGAEGSFRAYLLRAGFLASSGELDEAERDYRKLLELQKRGEGHELLGRFYHLHGRADDAIAVWREGLTKFPDNDRLKRVLTRALLVRDKPGDRDQALALLQELEQRFPDDPEVMWIRALVLLDDGRTAQAETLLERVVQAEPTAVDAQLQWIMLALRRGDYATARERAIRAIGANRGNADLVLARARAEIGLGQYRVARELALQILRDDPGHADAYGVLVEVARETEDAGALRQVVGGLEKIADERPDELKLQVMLARVWGELGEPQRGIERIEAFRQVHADADQATLALVLAELYRQAGDLDAAGRELSEASQREPNRFELVRARMLWLWDRKQIDELMRLLDAYRPRGRREARLLTMGGTLLGSTGRPEHLEAAARCFQRALEIVPQWPEALLGLALCEYQRGNVSEAVQRYREVLKVDPSNARALNDLAWILADAREDYDEALRLIEQGLKVEPNNVHLVDTRAFIYEKLGRLEDARRDYRRCVDLQPDGSAEQARWLLKLARVCAALKDDEPACRYVRKAAEIDGRLHALDADQQKELAALMRRCEGSSARSEPAPGP